MPRYVAAAACMILLLPSVAHADAAHGQQVFQRCAACHSIASSAAAMPGPNLKGVIGRRAGTLPGFEYSSAMVDAGKSDNVVWTRDVLDKYLTDPDDVVPGTAMRLGVQLTAGDRHDVIDYLEQVGKQ
ncbi:MAG TPA: c-type cytochrome [Alphaproteobacteria bacterium]|nr:c-type cytochrome [Alphaproteobacteria bacterium]